MVNDISSLCNFEIPSRRPFVKTVKCFTAPCHTPTASLTQSGRQNSLRYHTGKESVQLVHCANHKPNSAPVLS